MNDDFIPFELAVELKEKGFRERVKGYYKESKVLSVCNTPMNSNALDNEFSAPTVSQVLKWLREEKKVHIEIFLYDGKYSYFVKSITQICEDDLFHKCLNEDTTDKEYDTYEQAVITGISYVLGNLI